jgi:hypothetical protein
MRHRRLSSFLTPCRLSWRSADICSDRQPCRGKRSA